MPIVAHETITGVACCGCIIAAVEGSIIELRCNECGAVMGVVQIDILRGLLGLDGATRNVRIANMRTVPRSQQYEGLHLRRLRARR
jgi:hypothetical protein